MSPKRIKSKQGIIDDAKKMPPLFHKLPDEEFNYRKSRTLWWLVKQESVLKYIWDIVKQSGAIKYDPVTKKWVGVEFEGENEND